jgi:hypothetical protein
MRWNYGGDCYELSIAIFQEGSVNINKSVVKEIHRRYTKKQRSKEGNCH